VEYLIIDVPEEFMGVVMEKLGSRKAEMVNMHSSHQGYMRLDLKYPQEVLSGTGRNF